MRSGIYGSIIAMVMLCAPALAYDWSTNPGNGTPENPYQISEPNHLIAIGADPNLLDKCFILTNDIIFDPNNNPAHVFSQAPIAPDPDYTQAPAFNGCFNGNRHAIINLTVLGDGVNTALFGSLIGNDPEQVLVHNLTLVNPRIEGLGNAGALTGRIEYGTVESCHIVGGTVSSPNHVWAGGLTGFNNSAILSRCSSSASVSGYAAVGGLTGASYASTIRHCSAGGTVTSNRDLAGGLAGSMSYGLNSDDISAGDLIIDSYATGSVHAEYDNGGGLVGRVRKGRILRCYATGSVSGYEAVGGLIGSIEPEMFETVDIESCFATGDVNGQSHQIGGLIGHSDALIVQNCYAKGQTASSGGFYVGGLIGQNNGTVSRCFATGTVTGADFTGGLIGISLTDPDWCFWDTQTSKTSDGFGGVDPDPSGVTGLTTGQMKQQESFVSWDFLGESANGINEIWRMCADGVDYPRLSWEFAQNGDFACGDGVDLADLESLAGHWLSTGMDDPAGFNGAVDANGDEVVDGTDFAVLSTNWLY